MFNKLIIFFLCFLFTISLKAQNTEQIFLSGTDKDYTVEWDFLVNNGSNSGKWSTIPVPSNWELQGFGNYNYGRDFKNPNRTVSHEKGHYKFNFTVPKSWQNKAVVIVFEGSMTDTEVKINGKSAGPIHQGGFYEFRYDISNLLHYDSDNLLEVVVNKVSSNRSVNAAEREADYWIFGGIFRPVYLEAKPRQHIRRVAINAEASGKFEMEVHLDNIDMANKVSAQIYDLKGTPIGKPFTASVQEDNKMVLLNQNITEPKTWTAEFPNRYRVEVKLLRNGNSIHRVDEKFGFRTIEIRKKDGIYVNGKRIKLKGVNRHSFWPDAGRTTSKQVSVLDVRLMKNMNMNAVRMSHYPPDKHFLEVCDSLGLYVLNELAGWQDAYDTKVGKKLVRELVIRDVNHPSVIMWNNGNEGGWNTELDDDFGQYDPQNRPVLHPWDFFNGIDTDHYEPYKSIQSKLDSGKLVMPTELLHGVYDGGSGAGLHDYWNLIWENTNGVGLFLWNLADEGIVRGDQNNEIDVNRQFAPDGIVGPYRQKEGSFYTIKKLWSPVFIEEPTLDKNFKGNLKTENRYFYTNFNQCRFKWQLVDFFDPKDQQEGYKKIAADFVSAPDLEPQKNGEIALNLPKHWKKHDALLFTAIDPHGKEIYTWNWMIANPAQFRKRIISPSSKRATSFSFNNDIVLQAGGTSVTFSRTTGNIVKVIRNDSLFSLKDGPKLVDDSTSLVSIKNYQVEGKSVLEAEYENNKKTVKWIMHGDGWLQLDYSYKPEPGKQGELGISFNYPESLTRGITWLGNGPYRVWKNRMQGMEPNIWHKTYNDTKTGAEWSYPEFKGYHADLYWMVLNTWEGDITVVTDTKSLFYRLFKPSFGTNPRNSRVKFPGNKNSIAFLHTIKPTGSKFREVDKLGPESQPNIIPDDVKPYEGTLYFYFGNLP